MQRVNFKQIGVNGLKRYGGYVHEEFLPQLRWPQAGRIYKEMADNDPTIGAILYLAEMLIRGTSWNVQAVSQSAEDLAAKEFLESCMNDMEQTWANTICEILSMMTYGFSLHEEVYKVRRGPGESSAKYKSKYTDGKIGWRKLAERSQDSIAEWIWDEEGNLVGAIQRAEPNYAEVTLPMSKCLLFRTSSRRDNPEGRSLLRNAYRPWYFKKHFEEIEGIGIERDLAGFPVLTAPEGIDLWDKNDPDMAALLENATTLVSSIRRDSEEGVILPNGWDLKLLSSSSSRQLNIGETIERYDKRIAITLLSDVILLGEKSGSFALADVKQSMLVSALSAQLNNIADTLNGKAVPDLFKLNNFNVTEYPRIVPGNIQTPSLKEVALVLRAAKIDINKDFELTNCVRTLLGFPEITRNEFDAEQAKAQEEAAKEDSTIDGISDDDLNRDDSADREFEQADMQEV